jgi:hypothetical protein
LARNFDLVEAMVREFDEPVAAVLEAHAARFPVEGSLVAVAPSLETLNVDLERRLLMDKVLEELRLRGRSALGSSLLTVRCT